MLGNEVKKVMMVGMMMRIMIVIMIAIMMLIMMNIVIMITAFRDWLRIQPVLIKYEIMIVMS